MSTDSLIPISEVNRLLSLGVGDAERLRHILESVERNRPLYQSDIRYVTNLAATYPEAKAPATEPQADLAAKPDVIPDEPGHDMFKYPYMARGEGAEARGQTPPGVSGTESRPANRYKSEGVALCLSLTAGIFGFFGLGHRYVGAVWRGLGLLYLGWTLLALNLLGTVPLVISEVLARMGLHQGGSYWPLLLELLGYDPGVYSAPVIALLAVLPASFLTTLIWQALGAQRLCKRHNAMIDESGRDLFPITQRRKAAFAVISVVPAITGVVVMTAAVLL